MFSKIYRLKLFIKETSQSYPIHLCAFKNKDPTFDEFLEKIQRITEVQNIADYQFTTVDNEMALSDNQSLKKALSLSSSNQHRIEIVIERKPEIPHSVVERHPHIGDKRNITGASLSTLNKNLDNAPIPIIKPIASKWASNNLSATPTYDTLNQADHLRRFNHYNIHSAAAVTTDYDNEHYRKDSAISFDEEPSRKKQRVLSADHLKLPSPYTSSSVSPSTLPPLRNTVGAFDHGLHPLEIVRRPSTAPPPSPPPPLSPFTRTDRRLVPTLPAISTITSPSNHSMDIDAQLAPIYTVNQNQSRNSISTINTSPITATQNLRSSNFKHCTETYIPPSTASSTIATAKNARQAFSLPTGSLRLTPNTPVQNVSTTTNKRIRSSVGSTHYAHNIQQTSLFFCEYVSDHGKVCGQTFRRSYDLSRHQTIHLENRPFCYCDTCGKRFTRMDALRRHERVQGHTSLSSAKQRSLSTSTIPSRKATTSI